MKPQLSHERYLKELKEVLKQEWHALADVGHTVGLPHNEQFETIDVVDTSLGRWTQRTVVTQLPDGSLVTWNYEKDVTGAEEDCGPNDLELTLVEVEPRIEVVEVTRYVPVQSK